MYARIIWEDYFTISSTWWRHQMEVFIHVIGPLCEEFTGHAELWCFRWFAPWINSSENNRVAGDLRRHRAHYDVIVMKICIRYCCIFNFVISSETSDSYYTLTRNLRVCLFGHGKIRVWYRKQWKRVFPNSDIIGWFLSATEHKKYTSEKVSTLFTVYILSSDTGQFYPPITCRITSPKWVNVSHNSIEAW